VVFLPCTAGRRHKQGRVNIASLSGIAGTLVFSS
jgi:hypothetical protein